MENTVPVVKIDGTPAGAVDLRPEWIELERGTQAVKDCVVAFLAGRRRGTASAKTKGEVRGGGRKPWRQKGTGRARAGSSRSPLWRHGGVVFPPIPRDYAKHVNKQVRQLALKRTFSERLSEGAVIIVEDLALSAPKTRQMCAFLAAVKAGDDALVVVHETTPDLKLASRNLPGVEVMKAASVNPYWMLLFKKVVFTRAGLDAFVARFSPKEQKA
ncbi:MAG: 50S ribosomal protein L4 [Lentisphaerae bacterium ADurb.BinA184]|nr:MAG: 50S ribosomal protein L4 [Lentisphaerae bacterium ADurb.BinA184]